MKNASFQEDKNISPKRTLARDLALRLALALTIIIVALGSAYFFITVTQAQRELSQQATRRVEELANVLAIPLWNLDKNSITQISLASLQAENVVGLRVLGNTGNPVYEVLTAENDLIVEKRPIEYNGKRVGAVEIRVSTHEIAKLRSDIFLMIFAIVMVVALTILIATWLLLQKYLSAPLAVLTQGIESFASGDHSQRLKPLAQKELNIISEQFNALAAQIEARDQLLEKRVAERTAVAESARAEAESARKDIEVQMWVAAGQAILAEKMRGEQNIHQLAGNIISQLSQYLNAQAGALYLLDGKTLKIAAGYALAERPGFSGEFQIGEGLVGQTAADQCIRLLNCPENARPISSGLVDILPRQVLMIPFEENGQLAGVIELATLTEFTQAQMGFLARVSENIGVAFRTAQARQRLAEVLMETQQQTEELQTQEEELRAANEELRAQADEIKAKKTNQHS